MPDIRILEGIVIPKRENKNAYRGRLRPLKQVYREKELGIHVSLFSDITTLDKGELYRKLVPARYLTLVKSYGKTYILKDIYWACLLDFLKKEGRDVIEPSYVKLRNCRTI